MPIDRPITALPVRARGSASNCQNVVRRRCSSCDQIVPRDGRGGVFVACLAGPGPIPSPPAHRAFSAGGRARTPPGQGPFDGEPAGGGQTQDEGEAEEFGGPERQVGAVRTRLECQVHAEV